MAQELNNKRKGFNTVIFQDCELAIGFLGMIISDAYNKPYNHLNINFCQNSVNLVRQEQCKFAGNQLLVSNCHNFDTEQD